MNWLFRGKWSLILIPLNSHNIQRKTVSVYPDVYFNNPECYWTQQQLIKRLGIILGSKLSYEHQLQLISSRGNKTISLLRTLQPTHPSSSLATFYKLSIRFLLDYGNVAYDRASKKLLDQNLEFLLYSVAIALNGQSGKHHLRYFFKN